MIALAGTVALVMAVILMTKMAGAQKPIPVTAVLILAVLEVALVYYYMSTLEAPVP
jgi:hypothetical protein